MHKRKLDQLETSTSSATTALSSNSMDLSSDETLVAPVGGAGGAAAAAATTTNNNSKRPCLVDIRSMVAPEPPPIRVAYRRLSPSTGAVSRHEVVVPDNDKLSVASLKNAIAADGKIKMLPFPESKTQQLLQQQPTFPSGHSGHDGGGGSSGSSREYASSSSSGGDEKSQRLAVSRHSCNCKLATQARAHIPLTSLIAPDKLVVAAQEQKKPSSSPTQCDLCRQPVTVPCLVCATNKSTRMDLSSDDTSGGGCLVVRNGNVHGGHSAGPDDKSCNHVFHAHCLQDSLKYTMRCPSCRAVWVHKNEAATATAAAAATTTAAATTDEDKSHHSVVLLEGEAAGKASLAQTPDFQVASSWTETNQVYDAVARECKLQPGTFVLMSFWSPSLSHSSGAQEHKQELLVPGTELASPARRSGWSHLTVCGIASHAANHDLALKVFVPGAGVTKTLEVAASTTIGALKALLQNLTGIPKEQQDITLTRSESKDTKDATPSATSTTATTMVLSDNSMSLAEYGVWVSQSVSLRVTRTSNESVWLDLYTSQVHISSATPPSDLRKLLVDLVQRDQAIYVVERRYFAAELPRALHEVTRAVQQPKNDGDQDGEDEGGEDAEEGARRDDALDAFDTDPCQGFQDCFALDMAWQPVFCEQTNLAMSSFLSSLYLLANTLNDQDARALSFLGALREALGGGDFPPAIATMKMLIDKNVKSVRAHDKAALVNALFGCLRAFVPDKCADRDLFGHARTLFGYLLLKSATVQAVGGKPESFAATEQYLEVPLTCGLTSTRVRDPVYSCASATNGSLAVYSRSALEAELSKPKPRPELVSLFAGESKAETTANVMVGTERIELKTTRSEASDSSAPVYQAQTSLLLRLLLLRFPRHVRHDISLWLAPPPPPPSAPSVLSSSMTLAPSASAPASADARPKLPLTNYQINWASVVTECNQDVACLRIMNPSVLRMAPRPSLTQIDDGSIVVFTGSGKDVESGTTVFVPTTGQERTIDCTKVAKVLADNPQLRAVGSITELVDDDRPPPELLMILLDTSSSMLGRAGFVDDEPEKDEEADSDDEDEKGATRGPRASWTCSEVSVVALGNMSKRKADEAQIKTWRREFLAAREWLQNLSFLETLYSLAKHVDREGLYHARPHTVRELCIWTRRWNLPYTAALSRHRNYFARLLRKELDWNSTDPKLVPFCAIDAAAAAETKGDGKSSLETKMMDTSADDTKEEDEEEDDANVPDGFLCPITRVIMKDPVACSDGHSYERACIAQWLTTKSTSPMTGVKLRTETLTPNIALRKAIDEWHDLQAQKAKRRAKAAEEAAARAKEENVAREAAQAAAAQAAASAATAAAAAAGAGSGSKIKIHTTRGTVYELAVTATETVGDIKRRCESELQLGTVTSMIHAGRILKGESLYAKADEFLVVLTKGGGGKQPTSSGGGRLIVQTLTGKRIEIDVDDFACMTLKQVVSEIKRREGIPRSMMRLILCDKQLDVTSKKTLADYKISHNSTLYLILRLRGSTTGDSSDDEEDVVKAFTKKPKSLASSAAHAKPRVLVKFIDGRWTSRPDLLLFCRLDETVAEMKARLWALRVASGSHMDTKPSTFDLWCELRDTGDGRQVGHQCSATETLQSRLSFEARTKLARAEVEARAAREFKATSDAGAGAGSGSGAGAGAGSGAGALNDVQTVPIMTYELSRYQDTTREPAYMTRLQTVKQLFHAFINRSQAYDYGNRIALILFAGKSELACDFTASYETFRAKVDGVSAEGDTNLFEAINTGVKLLNDKHKDHFPKARKRIIVWSDGRNTARNTSTACEPYMVAQNVQRSNIVVDAIQVGAEQDSDLRGICRASGGYCFAPKTLADALKLNELETFLCALERPEHKRPELVQYPSQLAALARRPLDECSDTKVPERKQMQELTSTEFVPLDKYMMHQQQASEQAVDVPDTKSASAGAGTVGGGGSIIKKPEMARQKRIVLELRALARDPHKEFDVFVDPSNIGLWKLIVQGPSSTPYKDGCWMLYVKFGDEFPRKAPEVRFVTPIKHCNINVHGKVCHSIFDKNWTPDTGIMTVLQCVYGLLLTPDTTDPLDSTLALAFYDNSGKYEADILTHVKTHASKTRKQLASLV